MVRAFVSVFDDDDDVWRLIQPDQAVGSNRIGVALSAAASVMPRSALDCWVGMFVSSTGMAALPACRLARRVH
jgi:hypothetical protein